MFEFSIFLKGFDVALGEQPANILNFIALSVFIGLEFDCVPVNPLHALELASVLIGLVVDKL